MWNGRGVLVEQRAAHRVLPREVPRAERVDAREVALDVGQLGQAVARPLERALGTNSR